MTDAIKFKSSHWIEWCLSASYSDYDARLISEHFLLRDIKCNLLCAFSGSSPFCVYCESDLPLNPAVDIIVIASSESDISYISPKSYFKRTKFTGIRQEIWRNNSKYNLGSKIILEVITPEGHISNGQPGALSCIPVSQNSKKTSYLEKVPHYEAFSRDFSKLLEGCSSFDVVIQCEETKFNVHKLVLETRSEVFSAMLKSNMVEGNTGFIIIKGIDISIFEQFLRYLYTSILPEFNKETAKELYEVGDMYVVEELKMACSEYLIKNLSEGNACEILLFADHYSDEGFRKKVILYIVEKNIPQNDRIWSDFSGCHSKLAVQVLNIYIKKHSPK